MSRHDRLAHDPLRDPNPRRATPMAEVLQHYLSRRQLLLGGLSAAALLTAGCALPGRRAAGAARLGFAPVPITRADTVTLPPGYTFQVLLPWGMPLEADGPAYRDGGANTGAEQERQVGTHHDGMTFFSLPRGSQASDHGVLAINNEYADPLYLHARRDFDTASGRHRSDDVVRKEMAAHGITLAEIRADASGEWRLVAGSPYNRRITAATPTVFRGPAAGHEKLQTAYSPDGRRGRGTLGNCANGRTPWGTYLSGEENFQLYFRAGSAGPSPEEARYEIRPDPVWPIAWDTAPAGTDLTRRFHLAAAGPSPRHDFRHEANQFGWVVEVDPFDPAAPVVKRTALGRFSHEGAWCSPARDDERFAIYMGDDKPNEYLYKFVPDAAWRAEDAHRGLAVADRYLDQGTLYVARFHDDGSGEWLPLVHGQGPLTAANGFPDQATVLIHARAAADALGATPMDRPEWCAVAPDGTAYVSLTAGRDRVEVDAANPRPANVYGHILRWREAGADAAATRFAWEVFLLSGDPADRSPSGAPRIRPGTAAEQPLDASNQHANPDGLWVDSRGLVWIQTDMSGRLMSEGPFGNNQMLVAEPETGELRRFLVGPRGCEVTGIDLTPDGRTLFVNLQHPGDNGRDPSHFPDGGTRTPRSCTVAIRRSDGGPIGLA